MLDANLYKEVHTASKHTDLSDLIEYGSLYVCRYVYMAMVSRVTPKFKGKRRSRFRAKKVAQIKTLVRRQSVRLKANTAKPISHLRAI